MDYSDRTRTATEGAARAWDETRQKTEEMIGSGETCVRDHPGTALLMAFVGGAILGGLIGWGMAESRHEHRQHSLRNLIRDLQKRLEF